MNTSKPKIIVITGPTASGKSAAAIQLAQKIGGEIISADSRQIFRDLDIGSGKVHGTWNMEHEAFISEGIPHYLVDVAAPMEDFNVSHFQKAAALAIEKILTRGKIPIICGGTGFWLEALTNETAFPAVKPDFKLREKLQTKSIEDLFAELAKLDSAKAAKIDKNNRVRLIRAIEIATELGAVPETQTKQNTKYNFLQLALNIPREQLNAKIKKRLKERFEEGMLEEVQNLHKRGVSWEWLEKIGLEYRWLSRYLQNKISLEEMQEKLYFDIIHYAKRQMTWLRRNKNIIWCDDYNQIEKAVKEFLA